MLDYCYLKSWLLKIAHSDWYGTSTSLTKYIFYDIGCTFEQYLKARLEPETFIRLKFAVSILHSFGHEYKCQLRYSPRTIEGVGLADGEGDERVWSGCRYKAFLGSS